MKHTLRTFVMASVAVAAIAFTANSAMAESRINVPFEFKVGGKTLPSGQYVVEKSLNSSVVKLSSTDGRHSYTWLLEPGDAAPTATAVILKFDGQGDASYLRSIQYGSQSTPQLDKGSNRLEHAVLRVVIGR